MTSGGDLDNEICYAGQIYDKSSGLYYYNARYYDPENARFLTQDTYRGENEQPDTLHLYAYCKNNPINYVDPTGHISVPNVVGMAGFNYDFKQKIFYSKIYCWQRPFGYCNTYDRFSSNICINIHTVKSYFKYDKKRWRIQFWKGRYGASNGAEIGIYHRRTSLGKGWYMSATENNMLEMWFSLCKMTSKGYSVLFSRYQYRGWWLTGFKPGKKIDKNNLLMAGGINFKSATMAKHFINGLKSNKSNFARTGKQVRFAWR